LSTRRRRRGGLLVPSVAAGLLLAGSVPPWGWWPAAFAGAGLLYWRLGDLRPRSRFLAGWLAGIGCYGVGLIWAEAFNWYGAAVLIAVEALSMAFAAALVPSGRGRPLAFGAAFTLLEAVRMSWPFGGLPMGGVYLGQAGGPLLETARLGGPLLLTAVVWVGGAGLAEAVSSCARSLLSHHRERRDAETPAARSLAAGIVAVAAVTLVGVAGILAPDGGSAVGSMRVAAVQGGGRRGTRDEVRDQPTVFAAELDATLAAAHHDSGRNPRLVIWPEDVIALAGPLRSSPQGSDMSALARRLGATVLGGVTEPATASSFRNMAVVWAPNGRIVARYEKVHRVPFGEYVPDRSFFAHFATLSAVPLTAVPGHGTGLVRTPVGPLGVMISFEVFFANRSLPSVRRGAELLVVPTNTSSYATSQVPTQEVAAARVQAVEEGRDLVQAAPTGYSAIVSNTGAVLERSVLGRRQVLMATVGLRTGRTLYTRFGDLPVMGLAASALAAGWILAARGRLRRRRHSIG